MDYPFEQKQFSELSQIEYKIFITQSRQVTYADIMVVKFIGKYGVGSAGNSDAQFMVAMLKAAVWAWEPEACIIDLSELHYEWGDMMDAVLGFSDDVLQVQPVSVAGPLCSKAVSTLIQGLDGKAEFTAEDFVYKSMDEAFVQIEQQLFEANRETMRLWQDRN
jgi:hypothetical protein